MSRKAIVVAVAATVIVSGAGVAFAVVSGGSERNPDPLMTAISPGSSDPNASFDINELIKYMGCDGGPAPGVVDQDTTLNLGDTPETIANRWAASEVSMPERHGAKVTPTYYYAGEAAKASRVRVSFALPDGRVTGLFIAEKAGANGWFMKQFMECVAKTS